MVKTIFFLLFLFSLGYNAGPQFFKGLKKDGIPQLMFAIAVCTSGLIATIIAGKILGYKFGQNYRRLSDDFILKCTMNPSYWRNMNENE